MSLCAGTHKRSTQNCFRNNEHKALPVSLYQACISKTPKSGKSGICADGTCRAFFAAHTIPQYTASHPPIAFSTKLNSSRSAHSKPTVFSIHSTTKTWCIQLWHRPGIHITMMWQNKRPGASLTVSCPTLDEQRNIRPTPQPKSPHHIQWPNDIVQNSTIVMFSYSRNYLSQLRK